MTIADAFAIIAPYVCTFLLYAAFMLRLSESESIIMSHLSDLTAQLDADANAVSAKIAALKAELSAAVAAAGNSPTVDELAALQAVSDKLKALTA